MSRIELGSAASNEHDNHGDELAWIRPGATFTDDGKPNRITSVEADRVHGVSADDTWCWSWSGFVEAVRAGRVQHAPGAQRRGLQPSRQRLHLGEAAIRSVEDVSCHPLVAHYGEDLAPYILRTLQALRVGALAEPPLLIVLLHVAHAGAAAEGLSPSAAWPQRKGGRRSRLSEAAQDTQHLLARFQAWVVGQDDFLVADFQRVEFLAETGLKAIGALPADARPGPGRPAHRAASVRDIHSCLARRWRDHQRGTYRLSDAIRETARGEILHCKRVSAGWAGVDPREVCLDEGDEELLLSLFETLEVVYCTHPAMTAEERAAYRSWASGLLRLIRSDSKRTVS